MEESLRKLFDCLSTNKQLSTNQIFTLIKKYGQKDGGYFSKTELLKIYRKFVLWEKKQSNTKIIERLMMKPIRTMSGVAPVTVLTKPFPCPGQCIFCPNDIRMPKSYLSSEPGAQRAERNYFDPYLQVVNRLQTLASMGHNIEKVELIILGGTWSFYPERYQIWFIKRCLQAMNDFSYSMITNEDYLTKMISSVEQIYQKYNEVIKKNGWIVRENSPEKNKVALTKQQQFVDKNYNQIVRSLYTNIEEKVGITKWQSADWEQLKDQQLKNENSLVRNVGLVLETRPDNISVQELVKMRQFGCTKVQIGVQSTNDKVLKMNKRGHTLSHTKRAFSLLRFFGFKIHAHWMANLYGSDCLMDFDDYKNLFSFIELRPDELKIYPCSLIEKTELFNFYQSQLWKPYTESELLELLTKVVAYTPVYCRLSRIVRDIPSQEIIVGNKKTNFRQLVDQNLKKQNILTNDIRAREIRDESFDVKTLRMRIFSYSTQQSRELFLHYVAVGLKTQSVRLLGFLRLSLPFVRKGLIDELKNSAIIREVHVYGMALAIGLKTTDKTQHLGLGRKLIEQAKKISAIHHYKKLNVISAIGTKSYYRKLGFKDGSLYQFFNL